MNGVTLNTRTDEDVMEFPQFDFEVEAVIHCALWFTVPPLPLCYMIIFNHVTTSEFSKSSQTHKTVCAKEIPSLTYWSSCNELRWNYPIDVKKFCVRINDGATKYPIHTTNFLWHYSAFSKKYKSVEEWLWRIPNMINGFYSQVLLALNPS